MSMLSVLREVPGYKNLLAVRATSSIILWVDFTLIFSILTYFWHANPMIIGVASALYGLPGLFFGPFFGKLADNFNPLLILRASYAFRAVISLSLMLAPDTTTFMFFVLLKGLSNVAVMPAEQVLVRSMLTTTEIVENTRWITVIDQALKIFAPLIGAVLASIHQPVSGFGLCAALSLVALIPLRTLPFHYRKHPKKKRHQDESPLVAIVRLTRENSLFRFALIASLVQTMTLGLYDPLLALFLRDESFPAGTFGSIVSCTAAGGIAGAIVFKRALSSTNTVAIICAGLAGFGSTVVLPGIFALLAWQTPKYFLFACWVANGFFYGVVAMTFAVVLQMTCSLRALGTVSSIVRSMQLSALVLGPLVGSAAARIWSIPTVFVASGMIALGAGAALFARNTLLRSTPDANSA